MCIGLVIVACVACKKTDSPPAKGSNSAVTPAGDAAPVVALADAVATPDAATSEQFCISPDDEDVSFHEQAIGEKSIELCLMREDRPARCARLDLETGTFTTVAEVKKPSLPATEGKVEVAKLDLPAGHEWATARDANTIAATTDIPGQLFIVDAASGNVRKIVKWSADGGCMEAPQFIGSNIYVQYNVCAGPGATGWIVSPDGKKLGRLSHVNPTGNFFAIGGTRYAFEDFAGSAIEIVDGKTGKSVTQIEIPSPPSDCAGCASFRTGNLALVFVPTGPLLLQFGSRITMIDPNTGKIEKTIAWPLCPEPNQ